MIQLTQFTFILAGLPLEWINSSSLSQSCTTGNTFFYWYLGNISYCLLIPLLMHYCLNYSPTATIKNHIPSLGLLMSRFILLPLVSSNKWKLLQYTSTVIFLFLSTWLSLYLYFCSSLHSHIFDIFLEEKCPEKLVLHNMWFHQICADREHHGGNLCIWPTV